MLDIILRTCARTGAPNYTGASQRICGNDRSLMIKKCLFSLIQSINQVEEEVKLVILDDHSPADFLADMQTLLKRCRHAAEVVPLEEKGFNASAHRQFLLAKEARNLVYTVEDDYLHSENALSEMLAAYRHFRTVSGEKEVGIFPFDCPDRYQNGQVKACRLFHFNDRYWRTNLASANTLLTHASVFRTYWSLFKSLALHYPEKDEGDTINHLYTNTVDVDGPVVLVTPIPSLAVHLSYTDTLPVDTDMFDWRKLWEGIEL